MTSCRSKRLLTNQIPTEPQKGWKQGTEPGFKDVTVKSTGMPLLDLVIAGSSLACHR